MESVSTTPRRRKSPKRAAVLKAATEEFLALGFGGTSMDRIAEAARVSKRTVYDHFPSKDALFEAIVEETLQQIDDMPAHEYSSEKPLDEQLLAIGHTFADTITDGDFVRISRALIAFFMQSPEWGHNMLRAHARLRRDMVSFFKAGKSDGRLRIRDPEKAASQFCGLIKEVAYWPEIVAGQSPLTSRERREAVNDAVTIFLNHYAKPGTDPR